MLGGVLRSWRKRRDIATYARRLPRQLRRDCGPAAAYTPAQVRASIGRAGLSQDNSCYALAMYTDPAAFAADHAARGEACDFDAMRAEIAVVQFGGDMPSVDQLCQDAASDGNDWGGSDAGGGSDGGSGSDAGGGSDSGSSSSSSDV